MTNVENVNDGIDSQNTISDVESIKSLLSVITNFQTELETLENNYLQKTLDADLKFTDTLAQQVSLLQEKTKELESRLNQSSTTVTPENLLTPEQSPTPPPAEPASEQPPETNPFVPQSSVIAPV